MMSKEIKCCTMCHKPVRDTTMCDECRADILKQADALCKLDKRLKAEFGWGLDAEVQDDVR